MDCQSYAGGNVQHIQINQNHARDVQAYLDYYNIVGDDDGGKMMTEAEFEAYKKKVAYARANHLYVFYVNSKGLECKSIGPSSMCFCKHRFRNHNFDNIKTKKHQTFGAFNYLFKISSSSILVLFSFATSSATLKIKLACSSRYFS